MSIGFLGKGSRFEEAAGVGLPVLEEGAWSVVDGGAQRLCGEDGIPEEFGKDGGVVDEGKAEEEGGEPGFRIEG